MSLENNQLHLPAYSMVVDALMLLDLPISASEIHGHICAYLCTGSLLECEAYLRALVINKKEDALRAAVMTLFAIYTVSQQQITYFNFEFQLLLPDDNDLMFYRARAFSEWCEGFTKGVQAIGVNNATLDEEAQEAIEHLAEFAQLDYESLQVNEDDEKALMEVSEYARMAVLYFHNEWLAHEKDNVTTH